MATSEPDAYKEYVGTRLNQLSRLLQKYGGGDFSESIPIPEDENEFTELYAALNLMVASFRELIYEKDRVIAERSLAEEALKGSEERYRSFTENLNVGAYRNTAGAKGEFIRVNRPLLRMFGYESKEELFRVDVADLYQNPDERKAFSDKLARAGFVRNEVLQLRRKDGTLFWGAVSAVAEKGDRNEIKYYDGVIEDITERKRAEEALRASEQFLQNVFDAIQDGVSVLDTDLTVIKTNRWMEQMYLHRMPLAGQKCYQVYQQRTTACPWCPTLRTIETGQTHTEIVPYPSVDRPSGWIELSAFPIKDQQGHVTSVIEYVKDITERRNAEAALRESEARNRAILNAFPDMMFVQDRDGTFLDYYAADTDALFVPPERFLGRKVHEVFPAEFAATVLGLIEQAVLTQEMQIHEYPLRLSDQWRHFEARIVHYGEGKTLSVIREITDRKRAEEERDKLQEQFLQAQKMEAVGVLASGVAHDFNNLLTTIIGNAQLMLSDSRKDDPCHHSIEEIKRAGEKGAALTRQLLIFSRKETSRPEVLDLNGILQNIETMVRRSMGEAIELELLLSEDLARVMVDPVQIEQVIMNLAINARDAMPRGGALVIKTANIELDDEHAERHPGVAPGEYVMLAVTDTGCGMDEETLSRIFEPFFTTKEKGKGTGLGLSTVYGIVKHAGGDISTHSEPDLGTTFTIYLPRTHADARPPEESAETEERRGGEHILVVEDEESVCGFMRRLLSKLGYQVSVAADGTEALVLVEEKGVRPDLVITDVVMPGMSGPVLVDRLRRLHPALKVLFMSGYPEDGIAQHDLFDPGTPFIQKPFNISDLTAKLREIFREG